MGGAKLVVLINLSFLLITSSSPLLTNAFDLFSWTTHSTTTHHLLAPAPAPHHHKGHHNKGHHVTQPPVQPPKKSPVHPPSKSPVHPPKKSPVHPPSKSPVHPPTHISPVPTPSHPHAPAHAPSHAHPPVHAPMPVRKFVAVQGVVYCKSCKYTGVDTLLGATPLLGAVVKLQCNNTKYPLVQKAKTDKNGYFFIMAPKTVTTYAFHKCKVTLISSPMPTCNKPTNLHYGLKGGILIPSVKPPPPHLPTSLPYQVFNVGPFAFEPSAKTPCPRDGGV
ncbi:hypothetical protein LguiA_014990 [Lonicera macranthoides]